MIPPLHAEVQFNCISCPPLHLMYNTLGVLVKTATVEQNNQQLDVSDLSTGFYTIELKSTNGGAKQKLTIQK